MKENKYTRISNNDKLYPGYLLEALNKGYCAGIVTHTEHLKEHLLTFKKFVEENIGVEKLNDRINTLYYDAPYNSPLRSKYNYWIMFVGSYNRLYSYNSYEPFIYWNSQYAPKDSFYIYRDHQLNENGFRYIQTQGPIFSEHKNVIKIVNPPQDVVKTLPYLLDDSLGKFLIRQAQRRKEKREARALVKQRSESLGSNPSDVSVL